jgi:heptosyltransferase-2
MAGSSINNPGSEPRSVLFIALSGIGDALMASPAIRLLRQRYPQAQIDLLCMFQGVEDLYVRNPDIRKVLKWDFLNASPVSSLRFVFGLRGRYDVSVSVYPQNRWPYNLIGFLIGAPMRLGHDYDHVNLRAMNWLNTRRVREDALTHNVEENVRLMELLDVPRPTDIPPMHVSLREDDRKADDAWLEANGLGSRSLFVGIHAGSATFKNQARRRWSVEKYGELCRRLMNERGATILLFGGKDELGLNQSVNEAMGGAGHIVQAPFMTTAALMSRCALFVCNDTGLMHLAAGLGLPIVTIFAFTNPHYVYPWKTRYEMVRHDLECSPCFYYSPRPAQCKWKEDQYRCVTRIEVEEVWKAVEKVLNDDSGRNNGKTRSS